MLGHREVALPGGMQEVLWLPGECATNKEMAHCGICSYSPHVKREVQKGTPQIGGKSSVLLTHYNKMYYYYYCLEFFFFK
jgi:hypothetical protein